MYSWVKIMGSKLPLLLHEARKAVRSVNQLVKTIGISTKIEVYNL